VAATIYGITITQADDGIISNSPFTLLHSVITGTNDGLDYEAGGGGVCAYNTFTLNNDDGIDIDQDVTVDIFNNLILDNGDDGIEIRLHTFEEDVFHFININHNRIEGNGEDGIQIIDIPEYSQRILRITENLFINNAMAGLGVMDSANSVEDYRGADIPEEVIVMNNTFSGNNYGFTGGGNITFSQNIVMNSTEFGLANNNTDESMDYLVLFNNGSNSQNSNLGSVQILTQDPDLNDNWAPNPGSFAIDAGIPNCKDDDGTICDIGISKTFVTGPTNIINTKIIHTSPKFKLGVKNFRVYYCLDNKCNFINGKIAKDFTIYLK